MKKTNKTFKRFAAITSASLLAACAVAPVFTFAEGEDAGASTPPKTYSITIDNTTAGHTYVAYQIFTGTIGSDGELGNIAWGTGLSDTAKTNLGDADDKAKALTTEALANEFAATIAETTGYLGTPFTTDDDITDDGYVLSGLTAGYYLILDTTNVNGKNDTVTKYIMKVSDDIEVDVKTDMPTLEKKIWHNDTTAIPTMSDSKAPELNTEVLGQGWADVGDNQIGDIVYYMTKTSVPDMKYYDTYKYIIHDTLGTGLTFKEINKVVYIDKDGEAKVLSDIGASASDQNITINFGDLKSVLGDDANGGYIYTYYTATLDADALISNSGNSSQGNPNTAYLEYSNNPNASGYGDTNNTGKTPGDTVYDWTFTFSGVKVDNSTPAKPVDGAGFTLTAGGNTIKLIKVDSTNVKNVTADTAMVYYRIALEGETGIDEIITTEEQNKFMILGLDDSVVYTLTETTTPGGYNTCEPITIDLSASYTDMTTLTSLTNGTDPNAEAIVNNKGTSLPGTGGIGTTIFYLGGGAMAAIGGVYLISKRRMKKSEE